MLALWESVPSWTGMGRPFRQAAENSGGHATAVILRPLLGRRPQVKNPVSTYYVFGNGPLGIPSKPVQTFFPQCKIG